MVDPATPGELLAQLAAERERVGAELREITALVELTRGEVSRLRAREEQAVAVITALRDRADATGSAAFAASDELVAVLRRGGAMVARTLQELRGFIFELRPMILDDLGLVPTLRRYIQTLVDKHGVKVDFSSVGRDRRLPTDDEVAVFRLVQDALLERVQKAGAKELAVALDWRDLTVEIRLQSDGKALATSGELASGLSRNERVGLLRAEAVQEERTDGQTVLNVRVPIVAASRIIT